MKVRELIQQLSSYDEELEVKLAWQPGYPLKAAVGGVISLEEAIHNEMADEEIPADAEMTYDEEKASRIKEEDGEDVVYILQGNDGGYARSSLWSGR